MLALIVLLDQFSRNLHRGSPECFAADATARSIGPRRGRRAVSTARCTRSSAASSICRSNIPKTLADQDESVRLFETMRLALGDSTVEYAYRHRDLIRRFGRFPHRNAVLGRESTAEELRYLAELGRWILITTAGTLAGSPANPVNARRGAPHAIRRPRYVSPTTSATASTCSSYRDTGLSSRWLAPAATISSSRSRTCSGVPWMPEASVPAGL